VAADNTAAWATAVDPQAQSLHPGICLRDQVAATVVADVDGDQSDGGLPLHATAGLDERGSHALVAASPPASLQRTVLTPLRPPDMVS
jgi:hypothetical protein